MIFKLCTVAIVLVAAVSAYPAEDLPMAALVEAKREPVESVSGVVPEADDIEQPAPVPGDEDENLKGAESGWGGWGWGGYGRGHGWGGWGGYGGWGGRRHYGWGRGWGGGWGGYGGHGGWYGKHYWG